MVAARHGRVNIARVLLKANAKTYLRNKKKQTALRLAKMNGHPEIVALIEKFSPKAELLEKLF